MALFTTLKHSCWFTEVVVEDYKVDNKLFSALLDVLSSTNPSLLKFEVSGLSLAPNIATLSEALSKNSKSGLQHLKLKEVGLEEKLSFPLLFDAIAKFHRGLVSLDFSVNGMSKKSSLALSNALKQNNFMISTLSFLDLSHNKLGTEGSLSFFFSFFPFFSFFLSISSFSFLPFLLPFLPFLLPFSFMFLFLVFLSFFSGVSAIGQWLCQPNALSVLRLVNCNISFSALGACLEVQSTFSLKMTLFSS